MITIGEQAINIGDIAADGDIGQALAPLGKTLRDTFQITTDDIEVTDLFSEENDDPEYSAITGGGVIHVNFSVMNPDIDTLIATLGGTKTGTGDDAVWEAPANIPTVEKSLEYIPKVGYKISIPRIKLTSKIEYSNVRSTPLVIQVTGTVLNPTKAGVSKIKAQKFVAA